ncbi:cytochrome-c peroxidase [Jiulongibacter sp. NS-SX5]|uniref:cytochrome-c peroxidase n=1 Tax=Jiulongibacter sp. NS-SX5 TaxID=3463854 RepID=UPI004058DBAD
MIRNLKYILVMVVLWSCNETNEQPPVIPEPEPEEEIPLFSIPENFEEPVYDLSKNPITQDGFELGKKLFYDGRLSRDNTISCAECHNQNYAFTHHGHTISHGIDNQMGLRNAPPIQNTAWMKSFFWDGGVFDLDLFSIAPITNPVEMDEEMGNVLQKIQADDEYKAMFKKAFGTEEVTTQNFLKALSQFMNTLISKNSKYDKFIRNEPGGEFSEDELAGLRVFEQKCQTCHSGPLFSDESFRSNGLEPFRREPDYGRANITGNSADQFKFKVPSLRNLGYTAPYMHDGRYGSLESVLNHYSSGMVDLRTLDPVFRNGEQLGIPLTDLEKVQLIAFLKTLDDEEFIKDPRFAAP